ncbi:Mu-like prophage major head subunit gpT family protein [Vibrio cholerae]|uniref:Mu-like prophage major head subunit gpT family protein n=1 Tax=Vibrio cholerae TaxID=666 RepID=UPI000B012C29|nr:Mu-like prophage major head subunit gpT family protein [Vibrio cholerae]
MQRGVLFPQLAIGSKAALTEANYEAAIQLMGAMKRADGTPLVFVLPHWWLAIRTVRQRRSSLTAC